MPESGEFLQVFLVHDEVVAEFKQWVDAHGWELKLMPRFDDDDDTYVPTHMIVPKNLDEIMRAKREERQ